MIKEQLKVGLRIRCPRLNLFGTISKITDSVVFTRWDKYQVRGAPYDNQDPFSFFEQCEPYTPDDLS
jgi:hypothetical protein